MSRLELIEKIHQLPESSQVHIFHILNKRGIKYTENNNGVFFNLTNCEDEGVWTSLQHIVDQQTALQRENQERETRLREMQDMLRMGERRPTADEGQTTESAAASEVQEPRPPAPKNRSAATTKKVRGKTVQLPETPARTKHDILAMLAK